MKSQDQRMTQHQASNEDCILEHEYQDIKFYPQRDTYLNLQELSERFQK